MKIPLSDVVANIVFILCFATTALGGLIAVLTSRIIRAVCGLAICCFGIAGLYFFLHSPFLALMEILIYVGAVCVTIIFAVMLSEPDEPSEETRNSAVVWGGVSIGVAGLIFYGLWQLAARHDWILPAARSDGSMKAIGKALLTYYSLPFELISLALLVAILGALAIARTGRTKP
jgi:NADH:ubiquinone oxidoreductase subunit 6 (subunit J)